MKKELKFDYMGFDFDTIEMGLLKNAKAQKVSVDVYIYKAKEACKNRGRAILEQICKKKDVSSIAVLIDEYNEVVNIWACYKRFESEMVLDPSER